VETFLGEVGDTHEKWRHFWQKWEIYMRSRDIYGRSRRDA
jgi:hypothetical protein